MQVKSMQLAQTWLEYLTEMSEYAVLANAEVCRNLLVLTSLCSGIGDGWRASACTAYADGEATCLEYR